MGLEYAPDRHYRLWVQDTGGGFPSNQDFRQCESLGMRWEGSLSEHQLGGTIELKQHNGTTFTIMFPR